MGSACRTIAVEAIPRRTSLEAGVVLVERATERSNMEAMVVVGGGELGTGFGIWREDVTVQCDVYVTSYDCLWSNNYIPQSAEMLCLNPLALLALGILGTLAAADDKPCTAHDKEGRYYDLNPLKSKYVTRPRVEISVNKRLARTMNSRPQMDVSL